MVKIDTIEWKELGSMRLEEFVRSCKRATVVTTEQGEMVECLVRDSRWATAWATCKELALMTATEN